MSTILIAVEVTDAHAEMIRNRDPEMFVNTADGAMLTLDNGYFDVWDDDDSFYLVRFVGFEGET